MSNRFKQSDRYKFNWEDYHGYDLFVEFMTAEAQLQVKNICFPTYVQKYFFLAF